MIPQIIDAIRISDGRTVVLKHAIPDRDPLEIDTTVFLSIGDRALDPPQSLLGELIECIRQIIEGVQFMHESNIAHRDIMFLNTMMDPNPMYPELYHPQSINMTKDMKHRVQHLSRTEKPTTYYLIDFGLSRRYSSNDALDLPIEGGIKTVPEFQGDLADVPSNPFRTDIYYLGYMIEQQRMKYRGLKFLRPLLNDMIQEDPSKRPKIDEVAIRFAGIQRSLYWWQLRSRLVPTDEGFFEYISRFFRHIFRTCKYIATGYKAIPTPPKDSRITFCGYQSTL
ncbi:hypothetical protein ABKN59_007456 [Abortiporus biennis]